MPRQATFHCRRILSISDVCWYVANHPTFSLVKNPGWWLPKLDYPDLCPIDVGLSHSWYRFYHFSINLGCILISLISSYTKSPWSFVLFIAWGDPVVVPRWSPGHHVVAEQAGHLHVGWWHNGYQINSHWWWWLLV